MFERNCSELATLLESTCPSYLYKFLVPLFYFSVILCRSQNGIPPNTSLLYELELLEVQEPLDYSLISEDELITYL